MRCTVDAEEAGFETPTPDTTRGEEMVFIGIVLLGIAEAYGLEPFPTDEQTGILFVFMLIAFIGDVRRMWK